MARSQRGASGRAGKAASRLTINMEAVLQSLGANWRRRKGSVTAREVANEKGLSLGRARNMLERGMRAGKMLKEKGPNPAGLGADCWYYYPAKEAK